RRERRRAGGRCHEGAGGINGDAAHSLTPGLETQGRAFPRRVMPGGEGAVQPEVTVFEEQHRPVRRAASLRRAWRPLLSSKNARASAVAGGYLARPHEQEESAPRDRGRIW